MKKRTAVLLDHGFEELEAMAPIALLRRAGIEVDLISVENNESATGRFGVTYSPATPMNTYDFSQADCLLLPGGAAHVTLRKNPRVLELIHQFANDENKVIAAICASPTILGQEGLLKGKKYTCFTSMNEDFGGTYEDVYAVTDGNMVTGRSAAAAIDFAFAVIEKLLGKEKADEVKAQVYY
jgi:4-methyl-5(b-hydroxyethyl)-thiazole monophosphate biosynthesis